MTSAPSFLAFSCAHAPLHDPEAIDWAVDLTRETLPDVVICLGDLFEADSASRWPSEYDWPLSHELRTGNEILERFRMAAPSARHILLTGNHDDNMIALNRYDRKLRDMLDWRDHELVPEVRSGAWTVGANYEYNSRGTFRLGQVTFAHGYECGVSSDEAQSINLGMPHGLFVSGHTHRPVPVTRACKTKRTPLPFWFANAGTLRDMDDVPYMQRKSRLLWGQAVVTGVAPSWRYDASLIPGRPLWEAETHIFRKYEDNWSKSP